MRGKRGIKRVLFFVAVVIWVMAICISGCTEESSKDTRIQSIKIGAVYPLSGPDASAGEDLKAGIELAAEIINGAFELPIPLAKEKGLPNHGNADIQFLFKDSQSDPKQAADWVEKLINEDRVIAIMGCYSSTVTATASERAEIKGVPFLNEASTSPTLTQRGFKWFFRTTPDDAIFARNFFDFFTELQEKQHLAIPKRIVLVFENRLWGTNVAIAERKLALEKGYEIIDEIAYDYKDAAFDAELGRIKSAMPALILQASYDRDAVALIKGYKAYGINPVAVIGMDSGFICSQFLPSLGVDSEYIMSRDVWNLNSARGKPVPAQLNEMYEKKYGRPMTGYSARSFTAAMVLADAVNRAKSLTAEEIRESLLATDITAEEMIMPWDGVKFDAKTGQNVLGKGIIVQVQQGEYRIVWPSNLMTRPVMWPTREWFNREGVSPHDARP